MKAYIIDEKTRDKLAFIIHTLLEEAAQGARDTKATEAERELSHRVAQDLLDLEGKLLYAEGGKVMYK
jgi:hypothetical protein